MDGFLNLAKQGYSAYQASQNSNDSNPAPTGGSQYDSPDNNPDNSNNSNNYGSQYGGTGGSQYNSPDNNRNNSNYNGPQYDHDQVVRAASEQHGDSSHYRAALDHVNNNQDAHHAPIDEAATQRDHDQAYNQGGASKLSAPAMGGAAALQALKSFTSGSGGGGGSQSQLISLAMSEASKLFDSSGGAASGNKQDVINGAAMSAVKLLVQSKASSYIGGGNSGGVGSLLGMASKFM